MLLRLLHCTLKQPLFTVHYSFIFEFVSAARKFWAQWFLNYSILYLVLHFHPFFCSNLTEKCVCVGFNVLWCFAHLIQSQSYTHIRYTIKLHSVLSHKEFNFIFQTNCISFSCYFIFYTTTYITYMWIIVFLVVVFLCTTTTTATKKMHILSIHKLILKLECIPISDYVRVAFVFSLSLSPSLFLYVASFFVCPSAFK